MRPDNQSEREGWLASYSNHPSVLWRGRLEEIQHQLSLHILFLLLVETLKTDVLIIGSEGAGARVAQGDHDDSPQAFLEDMVIKDLVTRKGTVEIKID